MKIETQVRAGGVKANHNQVLLPVLTQIRSGRNDDGAGGGPSIPNHNETMIVRSTVKAGIISMNHNETLAVATQIKAGSGVGAQSGGTNHNESLRG